VPKKSKDVQNENANGNHSRVKKVAGKKPAAKKSRLGKTETLPANGTTKPAVPSEEQIRLRAYFLAERRSQFSLKGDHNSDWLEAKRQLFEEAGVPLS
jgi:hypothetical protein